ncbi:MAG TPA: hypothetical protein DEP88_01250 [Verrucomicrobiales bacterium]|jgi:hypothetical protein|nr:hypothetical protein [Verrucomicrobiales bacterium]HCI91874.1 hypothetical protein [Verrucomicrobiales bacterium]HCL97908.1 hypothetical protein [Verrucomicrobiales bacterium]
MPPSLPQPDPNYAITRIDLPNASTHGFQVRMQRRGIKYAKFFADRLHGHPQHALTAARVWRDTLIEKLSDQARICERSPRNSSGVVGVSKITVIAANGNSYRFWQATWSPAPGQRRCVKFSIQRYGDREAFQLAVEARTEGISD